MKLPDFKKPLSLLAVGLLAWSQPARADIELPAILGDNMVLQASPDTRLWGQGISGEKVTVMFQGRTYHTTVENNQWTIALPDLETGGPFSMEIRGFNRIQLNNILVGDVWLGSGQSNMRFSLSRALEADAAIAAADHPEIRLFTVAENAADVPLDDVQGEWVVCSPETVRNFSAVQYYFGREIAGTQDIPVGLVLSSVGGTRICSWISAPDLAANPESEYYFTYFDELLANYHPAYAEYLARLDADPTLSERAPRHPFERMPSGYFNAMIAPLTSFAVKGILWYQGETDSWWAEPYERMMRDLIWAWRRDWGQGELPFLIVQLASFDGKLRVDENYPYIREAQRLVARSEPNTALAVAIDVGEKDDIHPKDKEPVGHRLALAARHLAYGEDIEFSGPTLAGVRFDAGRAIVSFDHAESGLRSRSPELRGFELAGQDEAFHPARAEIAGNTVMLRSDAVEDARYVRYAWDGFPDCDLENGAGLPASPFRTDTVKRLNKEEWEAKYPEKLAESEAMQATLDVGAR
ncbi:sialate O-acetylesterase [Synoicihabitans lomoniglobus]|uniref:Sialate O-acetylesterase n=1 Tax=Synoicihabitans lomoniglobus TaxID=2909285 RepID=A0AAF0CSH7_9BACT|nr:sialate O-acetylesterase [Opitutaceae bacterium LMO-M01]WED67219.1 sialate O-acetylesterase [Opitutaceae bacterium LMO-M01]